jgi:hypothetical protein
MHSSIELNLDLETYEVLTSTTVEADPIVGQLDLDTYEVLIPESSDR